MTIFKYDMYTKSNCKSEMVKCGIKQLEIYRCKFW